ncbi:MAG: STAS/SEC14 domain-containing protein [Sphingomonas sp.]
MFTIATDEARTLMTVTMSGFLKPEDATSCAAQVQTAAAAMGWRTGEFLLLVDSLAGSVQSQSVIEAFQAGIAASSLRARKIAVVSTSSLARMQTKRVVTGKVAGLFENKADAEEWLFADA